MSEHWINNESRAQRTIRKDIHNGRRLYIYGQINKEYAERVAKELHVTLIFRALHKNEYEQPYWVVERK